MCCLCGIKKMLIRQTRVKELIIRPSNKLTSSYICVSHPFSWCPMSSGHSSPNALHRHYGGLFRNSVLIVIIYNKKNNSSKWSNSLADHH